MNSHTAECRLGIHKLLVGAFKVQQALKGELDYDDVDTWVVNVEHKICSSDNQEVNRKEIEPAGEKGQAEIVIWSFLMETDYT